MTVVRIQAQIKIVYCTTPETNYMMSQKLRTIMSTKISFIYIMISTSLYLAA